MQEMNSENFKVFVSVVQMGGLLGFHTVYYKEFRLVFWNQMQSSWGWSQHIFSETLERILYITWCKTPEDHHLTELAGLSVGLNNDSYQVLILCSVVK
jgi:hypothetical protein